jgi:class 3 adenylate cyclase
MVQNNASVSSDKRIEFRVGVNLGDAIVDEDDIHGDGVNVAARLEVRKCWRRAYQIAWLGRARPIRGYTNLQ